MRKTVFPLFVFLLLFTSCGSVFEFSMLQPRGEISNKLPSLEPEVYISTLENAYTKGSSISSGSAYSFGALGGVITTGAASTTNYADKRVNDVIVLFERDMKENVTNYIGEKKGNVTLKITNSSYIPKPKLGSFFGAWLGATALVFAPLYSSMVNSENIGYTVGLSLGIPSVTALVVPAFIKPEAIQSLEIEVEITDNENNVIGRYSGYGQGQIKSTMYKFPRDAQRIVNIEAFKDAMKQVKEKIAEDATRIKQTLN